MKRRKFNKMASKFLDAVTKARQIHEAQRAIVQTMDKLLEDLHTLPAIQLLIKQMVEHEGNAVEIVVETLGNSALAHRIQALAPLDTVDIDLPGGIRVKICREMRPSEDDGEMEIYVHKLAVILPTS